MDPFSLAAGIASLVGLAAQTIDVTRTYVREAKHGRESAQQFLQELDVLRFNLSRLDQFLRHDIESIRRFEDTSVLVSSTHACRNRLTVLYDKVSRGRNMRSLSIRTLVWPLDVKEHQEAIGELRAFAQWIQFSLSINGCALLSKTSTDVLEILRGQLEGFQVLQKADDRTILVERAVSENNKLLRESRATKEYDKILDWISTLDHKQKHHDIRKSRTEGTGQWFLQRKQFGAWQDPISGGGSVLWCHGIQGSGKSIMSSLVIDHLGQVVTDSKSALAYFYFNYQDRDRFSAETVLKSLLRQFSASRRELPKPVLELHRRTGSQQRPLQLEDLEQALLLTCETFDHPYLVIDALDECESDERKAILKVLRSLPRKTSVRILLTSRPHLEREIQKSFDSPPQCQIGAVDSDLRIYLSEKIDDSDNVDVIDDEFKREIITKIIEGAHQMFLLAVLQIKTILNKPTAGEMEEALEKMPRGLEDAFGETLQRIHKQPDGQDTLGLNTLMWLAHARRPLLVMELSEALAIQLGSNSLNSRFRPSQKRIIDCCMGLATVDEKSSVIRLVHYSVQEYLGKSQVQVFENGEAAIAERCITYLLFKPFAFGPRELEVKIQDMVAQNVFSSYAARYWGYHARAAATEAVHLLALSLLRAGPQRGCVNQILHYTRNYREEYWRLEEAHSCNGLHIAALFGLEALGRQLLDANEVGVDDATSIGTTALIKAAAGGHQDFVRMLLAREADLKKENWYGTALHCAAEAGTVTTILEILGAGFDINFRDSRGRSPLQCATLSGRQRAMKSLLARGADVNITCHKNYTALRYAIVWEQAPGVVRILLENGADTSIPGSHDSTPLHDAAVMNSEDALLLLLEYNADVHATGRHGGTPLHFAAEKGYANIIRHLLQHDANVDAKTPAGITPLYLAAGNGGEEAVKALILGGADIETGDDESLTPLHVAIREGHETVVKILIEAGAKVKEANVSFMPLEPPAYGGVLASAFIQAATPSVSHSGETSSRSWSTEMDNLLIQSRQSGLGWEPIATFFTEKSANSCQKRYERLTKSTSDEPKELGSQSKDIVYDHWAENDPLLATKYKLKLGEGLDPESEQVRSSQKDVGVEISHELTGGEDALQMAALKHNLVDTSQRYTSAIAGCSVQAGFTIPAFDFPVLDVTYQEQRYPPFDLDSATLRQRFDHIRQLNTNRGLPDDRKARAYAEQFSLDDDEGATAYTPGSQAFLDYKGQLIALEKQNNERLKLARREKQNLIPQEQNSIPPLPARPAQATFRCLERPCEYSSGDEDECKQHMENVHGWVHVRHQPSDDLNVPSNVEGVTLDAIMDGVVLESGGT